MGKRILVGAGVGAAVLVAYLAAWPTPIQPQSWTPEPATYDPAAFAANTRLSGLDAIDLHPFVGPEDLVVIQVGGRDILYASSASGDILRIAPDTGEVTAVANTGGHPLGMEPDADGALLVADAYRGLLRVHVSGPRAGEVSVLADTTDAGDPIRYADDVDQAADGRIYFSDASTRFPAEEYGALEGSILEILEHGYSGRLLVHDPATGSTTTLAEGLGFANGVAMCPNDACVLVAETTDYRVSRIWVDGPRAGERETVISGLPGFPDNINRGADGLYWVGLVAPRAAIVDDLADKPFLRAVSLRLPAFMSPQAERFGHVFAMTADGEVRASLQDPSGGLADITGAAPSGDRLYVTSLTGTSVPVAQLP